MYSTFLFNLDFHNVLALMHYAHNSDSNMLSVTWHCFKGLTVLENKISSNKKQSHGQLKGLTTLKTMHNYVLNEKKFLTWTIFYITITAPVTQHNCSPLLALLHQEMLTETILLVRNIMQFTCRTFHRCPRILKSNLWRWKNNCSKRIS